MNIPGILILALSSIFIVSCESKAKKQSFSAIEIEQKQKDTVVYRGLGKYPSIQAETNVDTLVAILAKGNTVYSDAVGVGGSYIEEYASFDRLKQIASGKRLFELLQYDSAAVRVYAFEAIILRDSTLFNSAYKRIKGKDEYVKTLLGCMGMNMKVKELLRRGGDRGYF